MKKIILIIASVVSSFAMHTLEVNINDKDLEIGTKIDLGQIEDSVEPDTTFLGFSYINASKENSEDESKNQADVSDYYEVNFLMKREVKNSGVIFGIGLKANYTDLLDTAFVSVPLGLEIAYMFVPDNFLPMYFGTEIYYAPESLSFGNAKGFLEFRVDYTVEVIDSGFLVFGFRMMETKLEVNSHENKIDYNKSGYIGFKFSF